MSKLGKKEGLATRQEINFFVGLVTESIELNALYKTGIKIVLPAIIDSLDNKVGDKLPEPWQTLAEDLITSVYNALQDKVFSQEEEDEILINVSKVLGEEIKVPILAEADTIMAFEFLLKFLATQVRIAVNKMKAKKEAV